MRKMTQFSHTLSIYTRRVCCGMCLLSAAGPVYAATERVVYSFKNDAADGAHPYASLIYLNGALYGTTYSGGGCGTVFMVNPTTGAETLVHSFLGQRLHDGCNPVGGLINLGGTLYGTTSLGGTGKGIVFEITPAGKEVVLHMFMPGSAAIEPWAALVNVGSTTLFGTTLMGGSSHDGAVFKVTTAGMETGIYSFSGANQGAHPRAGLFHVAGTLSLYGTTFAGGQAQHGTIFQVTTAGVVKILHVFKGGSDGSGPWGSLIQARGVFYGTTSNGGTGCASSPGCGTVYKVNPDTGAEAVVYAFKGAPDGSVPLGALINVGGTLYGTTQSDGVNACGTIFSVTPATGAEKVVYSFQGSNSGDGCQPSAGLTNVGGTLYGTTYNGGTNSLGAVFAFTP